MEGRPARALGLLVRLARRVGVPDVALERAVILLAIGLVVGMVAGYTGAAKWLPVVVSCLDPR